MYPKVIKAANEIKSARDIAHELIKMGFGVGSDLKVLPIPMAGKGLHAWLGYASGSVSLVRTWRKGSQLLGERTEWSRKIRE